MSEHLKLPRDPAWPALERQWLRDHPTCAGCGTRKTLQVHHKVPVHVARSMELDPNNLITLCEPDGIAPKPGHQNCHFTIGHLGNWYNYNRNVDKAAYDHLMQTYPKPGQVHQAPHQAPKFEPVVPVPANPAMAASAQTTEVPPTSYRRRPARR